MGLLRLLFSLEAHLVDIILKTLGFELELIVLSLKDSFRGTLLFDLFRMLDQKVIFLHLGEIALFSYLDQLCIQVRDATLALINVSTELTDHLLVPAVLQLQVE